MCLCGQISHSILFSHYFCFYAFEKSKTATSYRLYNCTIRSHFYWKFFNTNNLFDIEVSSKKKEDTKKGPGAKDDKGEKKGKEDDEDMGYRLTTSDFVKSLKAADKTYLGIVGLCTIIILFTTRKLSCLMWSRVILSVVFKLYSPHLFDGINPLITIICMILYQNVHFHGDHIKRLLLFLLFHLF